MRMVPAAMPVRSATSLMVRSVVMSPWRRAQTTFNELLSLPASPDGVRRSALRGSSATRARHVPVIVSPTILLTGATGYVGGQLLPRLLADGHEVRCLVRDRQRARAALGDARVSLVEGDVVTGRGLDEAAAGADVAYYLVHSMGGSGDGDFARRARDAARAFGEAMAHAGVGRTIYLGGLEGDEGSASEHLR